MEFPPCGIPEKRFWLLSGLPFHHLIGCNLIITKLSEPGELPKMVDLLFCSSLSNRSWMRIKTLEIPER